MEQITYRLLRTQPTEWEPASVKVDWHGGRRETAMALAPALLPVAWQQYVTWAP